MARLVDRGDTIIEMVVAFAVLSLAAIVTMAIMNKGIAMSQQSLETTLVRQQMDSQAEIVRYLHSTSHPVWKALIGSDAVAGNADDKLATTVLPLNDAACPAAAKLKTGAVRAFYVTPTPGVLGDFTLVDVDAATYADAETYARIDYPTLSAPSKSKGVWMQVALAEDKKGVPAYDVYVHGCWYTVGQAQPRTLGTIVRLYGR